MITVSFTEKPMTVRRPATDTSETSVQVTANTPITMTASWIVANAAPGAYRMSNRNARYSMMRNSAYTIAFAASLRSLSPAFAPTP
jgi:hypothetical protein